MSQRGLSDEDMDALYRKIEEEGDAHGWVYMKKDKTSYPCRMIRHDGNWCGYVSVPKGHPCFGLDRDTVHKKYPDLQVHGRLTYGGVDDNGFCQFGFDTAHTGDLTLWDRGSAQRLSWFCTYKDKKYVMHETNKLARQFEKIEERERRRR